MKSMRVKNLTSISVHDCSRRVEVIPGYEMMKYQRDEFISVYSTDKTDTEIWHRVLKQGREQGRAPFGQFINTVAGTGTRKELIAGIQSQMH